MGNRNADLFIFSIDFTNNLRMSDLGITLNANIPDLVEPELKNCDDFFKDYEDKKRKWRDEHYKEFMQLATEMFDDVVTDVNLRINLCFQGYNSTTSPTEVIKFEKTLGSLTEREVGLFVANKIKSYYKSHNFWCVIDIDPIPMGGGITDGSVNYAFKLKLYIDKTYSEYDTLEKEYNKRMQIVEERRKGGCH